MTEPPRATLNAAEKKIFESALDLGCALAMAPTEPSKDLAKVIAALCKIIDKYTETGADAETTSD